MTRHVPDKPPPAASPEIPHLHGPDESTLEIVVRFELLSLQQLLSCVNSRVLDEVTENVAELDRSHPTRMGRLYLYADTHLPLLSCKLQMIVFISTGALDGSSVLLPEAFLWSGRPV